ncbi:hypothetical protein VFPFJ_05563 [Purpureocillium lilacinum]|uniref:Uncharacterized protein n=1 Tax=Purpureocillium lilacinum TaxID=33203 RepID=A0A179HGJ4_PURLI|nr:hypothetical protein VFPFJ_05563 [Purpureocillium lilacinum]OAQ89154.1 hypothetical protein VFPFJ_05563 [Purpureocillium lilacinum]
MAGDRDGRGRLALAALPQWSAWGGEEASQSSNLANHHRHRPRAALHLQGQSHTRHPARYSPAAPSPPLTRRPSHQSAPPFICCISLSPDREADLPSPRSPSTYLPTQQPTLPPLHVLCFSVNKRSENSSPSCITWHRTCTSKVAGTKA